MQIATLSHLLVPRPFRRQRFGLLQDQFRRLGPQVGWVGRSISSPHVPRTVAREIEAGSPLKVSPAVIERGPEESRGGLDVLDLLNGGDLTNGRLKSRSQASDAASWFVGTSLPPPNSDQRDSNQPRRIDAEPLQKLAMRLDVPDDVPLTASPPKGSG